MAVILLYLTGKRQRGMIHGGNDETSAQILTDFFVCKSLLTQFGVGFLSENAFHQNSYTTKLINDDQVVCAWKLNILNAKPY